MLKIVLSLCTALALAGCERSVPAAQPAAIVEDPLPPDGPELFRFMRERLPELSMKVPCSCCGYSIGQCYHGACPPSCGPCNQIGRDVYRWHREGVSDGEIVARVRQNYHRR